MAKRSSRRASSPAPAIAGLLLRPVSRRPPSSCPPLLSLPPVSCLHTCFSHPHLPPLPTLGRRFLVDCCPPRFLCLPVVDCDLPRLASQRWQARSKLPRPPVISPLSAPGHNCSPSASPSPWSPIGLSHCDRQWLAVISPGGAAGAPGDQAWAVETPPHLRQLCRPLPNILSANILLHQF